MKVCPNCNAENRDTARFCSACATPLLTGALCPQCGTPNQADARFCSHCAAPLPGAKPEQPSKSGVTGLLPPQSVLAGRYLILEKVGQGGMGAVYKAADTRIAGKLWAVKELSDAAITNPLERKQASQDFQQEAHLLARLDHPNIPKVTDSFSQGKKKYLVMEFVEGETLAQRLDRLGSGPLPPDMILQWASQLCNALEYMHRQNPPIIFRDLKPGNVMITSNGQVKLIDFGIARLFKPGKKKDTQSFGTAGYAPPEQYGHGQTDARSDVYALGAMLHHLLTGVNPADHPFHFVPVRELNPAVPAQVAQAVMKALSQPIDERWQSAGEMREALGLYIATSKPRVNIPVGPSVPAPPAPAPKENASKTGRKGRPTTRLIMAANKLSNAQLATLIGFLLVLTVVGVWFGTPALRQVPLIWNNLPLIALVGPLAYAATQRRGVTFITHSLVSFLGGFILWQQVSYASENYFLLFLGAIASGWFMELWLLLLPKIKGEDQDNAWLQELIWLALMAAIGVIIFYAIPALPSGLEKFLRIGQSIGAAVLGAIGWFLGDLVNQYLFLRQTGLKRRR